MFLCFVPSRYPHLMKQFIVRQDEEDAVKYNVIGENL